MLTAYEFALYQAKPTGDITPFSIGKTKSQLPIKTKAEIVVNGLHLEKWAERKRGPWLKDAIEALILAIVNEECRNERTNIKEWFMNEYIDKG